MGDIILITKLLVLNMFFTDIPLEEFKPGESEVRRKRSHKRRRKVRKPIKGLR